MTITAASLLVNVDADTGRAERNLRSFSGQLQNTAREANNTGASLSSMFNVAGGQMLASTLGNVANNIMGIGQQALSTYAFTERLGASLVAMTSREMIKAGVAGSVEELRAMPEAFAMVQNRAKELQDWMEKFAIESPFGYEDVANAFRLSLAYGFTTTQAQRLTRAMSDFTAGSGMGGDAIRRMALALGQIKARGKVATQEINQLSEVGLDARGILAEAFGVSTAELIKMIEKGLVPANEAVEALVSAIERDFGSSAAEQAENMTGLMASMGDIIRFRSRDLFAGLFSAVQPYVAKLVAALTTEDNIAGIKAIGVAVGEQVVVALDIAVAAIGRFNDAFQTANNTVLGTIRGIGAALAIPEWLAGIGLFIASFGALTPVLSYFGTSIIGLFTTLGTVLTAITTPVGMVAAALVALYFAWDMNFLGIKDTTEGTIAVIQRFFAVVSGNKVDMTSIVRTLRSVFGPEMTKTILRFTDGAANAFIVLSEALQTGYFSFDAYSEAVSVFGADTMGTLLQWVDTVRNTFLQVTSTIENAVVTIQQIGSNIWLAFTDPGKAAAVLDVYRTLGISDLPARILQQATTVRGAMGEFWATLTTPGATASGDGLVGQASQMGASLRGIFERVASILQPTIERISASFLRLRSIFTVVANALATGNVSGRFGAITSALTNLRNALAPAATALAQALGRIVAGIGALLVVIADFGANLVAGGLDQLPAVLQVMADQIALIINTMASMLRGVTTILNAVMVGDWGTVFDTAKSMLTSLVGFIITTLTNMGSIVTIVWGAIWQALKNTLADFGIDADAALAPVVAWFGRLAVQVAAAMVIVEMAIATVAATIVGFMTPAWNRLTEAFGELQPKLTALLPSINGIIDAFARLGGALLPYIQAVATAIGAILLLIANVGVNLAAALINNLPALIAPVLAQVQSFANAFRSVLNELSIIVNAVMVGDWGTVWASAQNIVSLARSFIVSTIENMRAQAAAIFNVMKETVVGVMSDMGIDVNAVVARMGAGWLMFTGFISGIVAIIQGKFTEIQNNISGAVTNIAATFETWRGNIANIIPNALTTLQSAWNTAWTSIQGALAPAIAVVQPAFDRLRAAALSLQTRMGALSPSITALQTALSPLGTAFDSVKTAVSGAWAQLGVLWRNLTTQAPLAQQQVDLAMAGVTAAFTSLQATAAAVGAQLQWFFGTIATVIGGVFTVGITFAVNYFAAVLNRLPGIVQPIINSVTTIIQTITGIFTEVANSVKLAIEGDWKGAFDGLSRAARLGINGMKSVFNNSVESLKQIAGTIKDAIVNTLQDLGIDTTPITTAIDKVKALFNDLKGWFDGLTFPNPFANIVTWANEAIAAVQSAASWIPGFAPQATPTTTVDVPSRATGDLNFRGGMALVGEEGPELVTLPRGVRIFPNDQTVDILNTLKGGNDTAFIKLMQALGIPGFAQGTVGGGTTPTTPVRLNTVPPDFRGTPAQIAAMNGIVVEATNVTVGGAGAGAFLGQTAAFAQVANTAMTDAATNTETAFVAAAKKTSDEFANAVRSAPGLFGTSEVTQEQMDMAAVGIPQNFADDYLRRLTDEVLNGVDWEGVDIGDAATRAGIDPNLPKEMILQLFKKAWSDSSLFADAQNLDLINQDAVRAYAEQLQNQAMGEQNILQLFGITPEGAAAGASSAMGSVAQSLTDNMPVEALNQVGQEARENIVAGLAQPSGTEGEATTNVLASILPEVTPETVQPTTDSLMSAINAGIAGSVGGADFATSLSTALGSSIATDDSKEALATVGDGIWAAIWEGIRRSAESVKWDGVVPIPASTPSATGDTGATPPGYARGTRNFPGGVGLVGEMGAELVRLPRGSTIYSATETEKILSQLGKSAGSEPAVVIQSVSINNDMELEQLAYKLDQLKRRRGR